MKSRYATTLAAIIVFACTSAALPAIPEIPSHRTIIAQAIKPHPDTSRPTVCTQQYSPVCARANGAVKTYPNRCFAWAAGAEVIAQGPCIGGNNDPSPK